jgi:predicted nucleotidyltransferase component of viral defense system
MATSILTPHQKQFLDIFQKEQSLYDTFYFTGGTCLAEYYLQHRLSEDLDFFSEQEFQPQDLSIILKKHQNEIGYQNFDFQQSFNRNMFFLTYPNKKGTLKVEFTYFPFPHIEEPTKHGNLTITSLRDIAVNKVFTIAQNPRGRDYYDLFEIMKKEDWTLEELIKQARFKFDYYIDRVQLGAHLQEVDEKLDDPILTKTIKKETVISFFKDLAHSFKNFIFI